MEVATTNDVKYRKKIEKTFIFPVYITIYKSNWKETTREENGVFYEIPKPNKAIRVTQHMPQYIIDKLKEYNVEVVFHKLCPDDPDMVTSAIKEAIDMHVDMVICTGGMSVDPDDKTPLAIKNTGANIISYGSPVLPGAMFLLSYKGDTPIVGLPGCVMYAKRTVFDLVLPRLVANDPITADELAMLGEGGLCLNCPQCTFPNCGFGK